jgi:FG-GAP repeat
VLLGSATGLTSVGNQVWHQNSVGIDDTAEASDFFGSALAVGDFNTDGFDDLAIGVHNEAVGAIAAGGVVHVLLGSATGLTATGSQFWNQDSGTIQDFVEAGDEFGRSLAAGDVNRDGFDDLVVGVPREDLLVANAGSINLLLGSAAGLTDLGNQAWHQDSVGIEDTAEADDQFGHALAAADFDADGFADLAIGVVDEDVGALADTGAVHLLMGFPGGFDTLTDVLWHQDIAGVRGVAEADEQFGDSLAAGDVDNDGFADLAVGVQAENEGALFAVGAINILPGSAAGLTAAGDQRWHQDSAGILNTAEFGDGFGNFGRGFR